MEISYNQHLNQSVKESLAVRKYEDNLQNILPAHSTYLNISVNYQATLTFSKIHLRTFKTYIRQSFEKFRNC